MDSVVGFDYLVLNSEITFSKQVLKITIKTNKEYNSYNSATFAIVIAPGHPICTRV